MLGIPKGSILEEVAPYAVVPLHNGNTPSHGTTVTNCSIGMDPTYVPNLEDLPKWEGCQIWNQEQSIWIFEIPAVKKFLRRARRMASSSADDVVDSWNILCILTILRVVADNVCNEKQKVNVRSQNEQIDVHSKESVSTQQDGNNEPQLNWWSILVSEHYDDDNERKMIQGGDDYEDESYSLLVELWPLIQEHIPWMACQRLFRRIQNRLHVLTIPHPLKTWAQTTIFELTNNEFETSWKVYLNEEFPQKEEARKFVPPNRLRASKLWLDRVANIPERLVGVLIDDPLKVSAAHESKCVSMQKNIELSTALTLPRCYQSCLPNTCLELHAATVTVVPDVEKGDTDSKIICRWIALYDLSSVESENKNRTLSTMPKSRKCNCFQCVYENESTMDNTSDADGKTGDKSPRIDSANLPQARRLAHSYFYKEAFGDAMSLYQQCHRYCASSCEGCTETDKNSTNAEWKAQAEADLWHTMGAVILSQQKFARAQQHWKNGSHYQNIHKELSEQLEKQRAYQYFHPLIAQSSNDGTIPSAQQILRNPTNVANQSIFITSEVIDIETCHKLITWAKDYALDHGGWTASRHYAVPTTDLPIHKVPKLLKWFQEWMPKVLFPILRDQFGSARCDNSNERFYVHDAFLVRYEATASSCFLPLHRDESTHSCVLALNDDFDGGGSYIYDLNRSIDPGTGGMVSFLGNRCLHGGNPVTRGVRYILAIFLFLDRDLAQDPVGKKDESSLNTSNETKGNKRSDETNHETSDSSKRLKKEDGPQELDKGGGGFSFSFF